MSATPGLRPNLVNGTNPIEQLSLGLSASTTQDVASGGIIQPTAKVILVQSATAGAITADGTTAVANGYFVGQELFLVGQHATKTVQINDGANVLSGGNRVLALDDCQHLIWLGDDWQEVAFNNA